MEELFAAILSGIAEIFGELLCELVAEAFTALVVRFLQRVTSRSLALPSVVAIPSYFLLGTGLGFLSLLLFPHPLFHPSRFHGVSLLISPTLAGLFMSFMGAMIRRRGKRTVRIESFGYGFTFALGMAIVRVVFTR